MSLVRYHHFLHRESLSQCSVHWYNCHVTIWMYWYSCHVTIWMYWYNCHVTIWMYWYNCHVTIWMYWYNCHVTIWMYWYNCHVTIWMYWYNCMYATDVTDITVHAHWFRLQEYLCDVQSRLHWHRTISMIALGAGWTSVVVDWRRLLSPLWWPLCREGSRKVENMSVRN